MLAILFIVGGDNHANLGVNLAFIAPADGSFPISSLTAVIWSVITQT